ncbi:MAG: archease [Dehalococcoidia bacterium]|nr:archease [Dehalococcoidia bacterium]
MSTQPFEIVSHTADIAMAVRGRTLAELMANAGCALYSMLLGPCNSTEQIERTVVVDSIDRDALLVDWLNELIYMVDVEQLAFARFEIVHMDDTRATVRCFGHPIDETHHRLKRDIKAATHHMAQIESDGSEFTARVILDI